MIKSKSIIFFILLLLNVAIIFFGQSKPILLFENYLSEALRPFEIVFSKIGNKFLFWQNAFLGAKALKESNIKLSEENL